MASSIVLGIQHSTAILLTSGLLSSLFGQGTPIPPSVTPTSPLPLEVRVNHPLSSIAKRSLMGLDIKPVDHVPSTLVITALPVRRQQAIDVTGTFSCQTFRQASI